jgi:hypothetical protein
LPEQCLAVLAWLFGRRPTPGQRQREEQIAAALAKMIAADLLAEDRAAEDADAEDADAGTKDGP